MSVKKSKVAIFIICLKACVCVCVSLSSHTRVLHKLFTKKKKENQKVSYQRVSLEGCSLLQDFFQCRVYNACVALLLEMCAFLHLKMSVVVCCFAFGFLLKKSNGNSTNRYPHVLLYFTGRLRLASEPVLHRRFLRVCVCVCTCTLALATLQWFIFLQYTN